MDMRKRRGFEVVKDEHRQHKDAEIILPIRGDDRSAGYDFFAPRDITLLPAQKTLFFSDVKAYMQEGEVLKLYPRSSMGVKKGLMLSNTVGVIDASYYENEGNDGNIGFALLNTSGRTIEIKAGERIVQGVFTNYLVADEDVALREKRDGGFGSSGK
jgi:dUTP pyrophosphatase